MKILSFSDSHNLHYLTDFNLDGVDMLLCAGDFSRNQNPSLNHHEEVVFLNWFEKQKVKYKVLIAGNHETALAAGMLGKIDEQWDIITLNHETKIIGGVEFFGSPYTPSFGKGWAYNIPKTKIKHCWAMIPRTTQVLVTHGPPHRILDSTPTFGMNDYKSCGCPELLKRVKKVKPEFCIFGHIHEDGGRTLKLPNLNTTFINAAVVGEDYKMRFNKGVLFEINEKDTSQILL